MISIRQFQPIFARNCNCSFFAQSGLIAADHLIIYIFCNSNCIVFRIRDRICLWKTTRFHSKRSIFSRNARRCVIVDRACFRGNIRAESIVRIICFYAICNSFPTLHNAVGKGLLRTFIEFTPCPSIRLPFQNIADGITVNISGLSPCDR